MTPRIFVQIAAYRDPELLPTLADCLARAADPKALRFGLCWQHDEGESLGEYARDERFRILDIDYRRSRGACWARNRIQSLHDGEPYTLHLDSHHRFADGWDETLLEMLRDLQKAGVTRPLLTSYAPSYQPDKDPSGRDKSPYRMKFRRFAIEGLAEALPESMDGFETMTEPLPARFFSAHLAFTLGQFCQDVPHDPKLYFFGEEPTLAVRAFTHGYDMFHPHRIIAWHHYIRDEKPKHWADHDENWIFHHERSMQRVRQLLRIDRTPCSVDFGPFGLGTRRSLRDYEKYAGIHYGIRGVSDHALQNRVPPEPLDDDDDEERWAERFVREQRFRIHLKDDEIPAVDDFDFFFVGAHARDETEIYREDLHGEELDEFLRRQPHARDYVFYSTQFAESWTVWPHSRSRGWLEKITRKLSS